MKNIKPILSLAIALVFICSGAIAVSASAPLPDEPLPAVAEAAQTPQVVDIIPDMTYEETAAESVKKDTAAGDNAAVPVSDDDTNLEEESQEEQQPQPARKKSNNTPYFVGAVIAVIVFIGVALYCKFNGGGAMR